MKNIRSLRNKTIELSPEELIDYSSRLISLSHKTKSKEIPNKTINQDLFETFKFLPDKLIAKLKLAITNKGDIDFDPFPGSGIISVTAKKINRNFVGVEIDKYYASLAEKRLELAEINSGIQGYDFGVFWERNTTPFPTGLNRN